MQKVYYSFFSVLMAFFLFLITLLLLFHERHLINWFCLLGSFCFMVFTIVGRYKPSWEYDEKGIKRFGSVGKGFYRWDEINEISLAQRTIGAFVCWNDGNGLSIDIFFTKNYSKVLFDIVKYVRKNSPKTKIDPRVLKKIGI